MSHFVKKKDDSDKFKFEKQKRKSQFGLKLISEMTSIIDSDS